MFLNLALIYEYFRKSLAVCKILNSATATYLSYAQLSVTAKITRRKKVKSVSRGDDVKGRKLKKDELIILKDIRVARRHEDLKFPLSRKILPYVRLRPKRSAVTGYKRIRRSSVTRLAEESFSTCPPSRNIFHFARPSATIFAYATFLPSLVPFCGRD